MMGMRTVLLAGLLIVPLSAAERSGRATAEWISASSTFEPGKALRTGIRLVIDAGWHSYWLNPGEAGMKTSVDWQLPAGWTATDPAHPVPKRFRTGGLSGFGYDGAVIFPVTVMPPVDFKGRAILKARVSWLACNDSGCVPGEADLSLELDAGPPAPTAEAAAILDAAKKIPRPQEEWARLNVKENPTSLVLTLEAYHSKPLNLDGYEIFPVTAQVIDPAAEIRFSQNGSQWRAEVPKSEYAASPVTHLTLVFAGDGGNAPIELTWRTP